MQSKGQVCVRKFRENFSKTCVMKKNKYKDLTFYILKMLNSVWLILGMNFKDARTESFRAVKKLSLVKKKTRAL